MKKEKECNSEEGITVGIIDTIINSLHLLKGRDVNSQDIEEAILDMRTQYETFIKNYIIERRYKLLVKKELTPEEQENLDILEEEFYLFPTFTKEDQRMMTAIRNAGKLLKEKEIIK